MIPKDRPPKEIRTVAGVDVSYVGDMSIEAVTVLDYGMLELMETQVVTFQVKMPYVPTLLSFNEIPLS